MAIVLGIPAQAPLQSAGPPPTARVASQPQEDFVPGEILIKRVDRVSDSALKAPKRRVGGRRVKSFPGLGIEVWKLESGMPVGRAVAELKKAEFGHAIDFAEPNWLFYADEMPNDPRMQELWGLLNVGQTGGTVDADIDAPEAWGETTGLPTIVIGVIDTGVDYTHEDLADNIWVNADEVPDNGLDDDDNGYIDDIRGWDFVNDDNDPMDDHWHGTHTSGTIGAIGDNGIGVSGVNWEVKIMPLKFLNSGGYGSTDDAIEAVLYAAGHGVPITNNSWGGGRKSRALEDATRDSGSLFVASAGNSGSSRKQYPAGYALDNVLSVAATDHDDQLASFSNFGPAWVDLAAPGVDVLSTVPVDDYDWASGTSMAAPHVAGVAGLVMAAGLASDPISVKNEILTTVDPLDSLAGLVLSGGRLNAARAVGIEPPGGDTTPPAAVGDLEVDLTGSRFNMVSLTWTAPGDDESEPGGAAVIHDVRYDLASITEESFEAATQAEGEPAPQTAGTPEAFTVTGLASFTRYFFAMKSIDDAGNISPLSNVVSATTSSPSPPEFPCDDGIDNDGDGDVDCADFDCMMDDDLECNCGNNVCELGETTDPFTCGGCPEDCLAFVAADWSCGDRVCQPEIGEDCTTCPADCDGRLRGNPANRFCCGGSGQYGVGCTDPRCSTWPDACDDSPAEAASACCGDGIEEPLEHPWSCGIDVCPDGSDGLFPELFLVSYYLDWNDDSGITTLAAGARYNLYGMPNASPLTSDIPECRIDCFGTLRAYYHDVVSGAEVGERFWGNSVDTSVPCVGDACCSHATDAGYNLECCVIP